MQLIAVVARRVMVRACAGLSLALVCPVPDVGAQPSCRTLPAAEAAPILAAAFVARMAGTGAGAWHERANEEGLHVYVAAAANMGLSIAETGGLASSITVMVDDASNADFIRLKAGASFVVARLSETPEAAIRAEVSALLEQARAQRKVRAKQVGDVVVLVAPVEAGGLSVSMNRRVCN